MRKTRAVLVALLLAWTMASVISFAQESTGTQTERLQKGMEMTQEKGGQQMGEMMTGQTVPAPDLLITTFDEQVVLPDKALEFVKLDMGTMFYGKLIAKVDFGGNVWFSIRKARIPRGGNVGIMSTTEICYIETGLGLLMSQDGKLVKTVPAGAWFTVPAGWKHTMKSIGEEDLIMTVIRVGPKGIH